MRYGALGFVMAVTVGAGLSWGQNSGYGTPSVIPPQLPGMGAGGPGADPSGAPTYPPPANWDAFNLNGPASAGTASAPRYWFNAEYLWWFPKSSALNAPVATTSSPADAGVIGATTTTVFEGNSNVGFGASSGYRLNLGWWLDSGGRLGINFGGLYVNGTTDAFNFATNALGTPLLARPFVDPQTATNGAYRVGALNFTTGTITDSIKSSLVGGDVSVLASLFRSEPDGNFGYTFGFLAGVRFLGLNERTTLSSTSSILPGGTITLNNQTYSGGTTTTNSVVTNGLSTTTTNTTNSNTASIFVTDRFKTHNDFYGGNLGLFHEFHFGRLFIGVTGKLGLGDLHQTVNVQGLSQATSTTTTTSNVTIVQPGPNINFSTTSTSSIVNQAQGGIYAVGNEIGRFHRNNFTVIPEMNLSVGYHVSSVLTAYVGYNLIMMNNVVRPNTLITGQSSPSLQPTNVNFGNAAIVPQFNAFPTSNYIIQGLSVGIALQY